MTRRNGPTRRHKKPTRPLTARLAEIEVDGSFPFRDNPRLEAFLNDVRVYCDGVRFWRDELGIAAKDRLDKLPSALDDVISILESDEERRDWKRAERDAGRSATGDIQTNLLRLATALRRAGHDDVVERLPQLIEDLQVIYAVAPKAHYARPKGQKSPQELVDLVDWLAEFWEAETDTRFAGGNWSAETGDRFDDKWDSAAPNAARPTKWESGAPNGPTRFVVEIVVEFAPENVSRLPTVTKLVAKGRTSVGRVE